MSGAEAEQLLGSTWTDAVEEYDLLRSSGHGYDHELFLSGAASPVLFGSAVLNFGVRQLLDTLVTLAPAPGARPDRSGTPREVSAPFSGFVFKIQAGMDRAHRDRLAFVRVCSGRFTRGMVVTHADTGRPFATKYAQSVFGRDRSTLDEAFPGDVIGLVNANALRVGDTLFADEKVAFPRIPLFAPEHFAVARATAKCSGAKSGMRGKATFSSANRVSPTRRALALTRPMTSPGKASSSVDRSRPKTLCAYFVAKGRPGVGVRHDHAAREAARAHPDEREPVAVRLVHARLDLEDEAREGRRHRRGASPDRSGRAPGRGRERHERVEQLAHAEVEHGRAEEHRRRRAREEELVVEVVARRAQQVVLLHRVGPRRAEQLLGLVGAHPRRRSASVAPPGVRVNWTKSPVAQSSTPWKSPATPTGQVSGIGCRSIRVRQLVHDRERVEAGPVPLVDDGDDGHAAGAADLEELERLGLDALGRVDEHDGGVDRGEHPVGVLGEVRVTGGVEQVDDGAVVGELEHGGGDRDASVLLHLHPVRDDAAAVALAVHGAGLADGARVQGERLGQGRLAGVGVRDDGEGAAAGRLLGDRSPVVVRAAGVSAVRDLAVGQCDGVHGPPVIAPESVTARPEPRIGPPGHHKPERDPSHTESPASTIPASVRRAWETTTATDP